MNNYLQAIILYAIKNFKVSAPFMLYTISLREEIVTNHPRCPFIRVNGYFGTMPRFTRQQLNQNIEHSLKHDLINLTDKPDAYEISLQGERMLDDYFKNNPFRSI